MCDSTDRRGADQVPPGAGPERSPRPYQGKRPGGDERSDQAPQEVRFLVDGTAGKLVRWLRLLGFDSSYSEHAADYRLVHHARAEGRVLLTRRRSVCYLPWADALLLESDHLTEQLVQVTRRFRPPDKPLTRCSLCNALLVDESKESVREEVPPFVYKTASAFSRCSGCGHVYWRGTHCSRITGLWKALRDPPG